MSPTTDQSQFLRRLVVLASQLPPSNAPATAADLEEFERVIMSNWESLRWRLLGAAAEGYRRLGPSQRAMVQALERAPSLLGPLERGRDETTHTRLLTWFLGRVGPVGDRCRSWLLEHVSATTTSGWRASSEVVFPGAGRVDIVIETPRDIVFIEAKIDAEERPRQLDDYAAALEDEAARRGRSSVLMFLTAGGADHAKSTTDRIHVSMTTLFQRWLPGVLAGGPDASYLAAYLRSVADEVLEVAEEGEVDDWSLANRHALLTLLQEVSP